MVHQPYGHGNIVFSLPQLGMVAKTSSEISSFAHTVKNIELIRSLDVPVPTVVGMADDGDASVIVLEWLPGMDLGYAMPAMSDAELVDLAHRIDEIQRKVASLGEGRGFGWTPIGVPGPFSSWLGVVKRDFGRLPDRARKKLDPILFRWSDDLLAIPATPFLDDITVKNVIVHEGRLSGIVDLDFICFGDPLYWLALTETTVNLDVGQRGRIYVETLRSLRAPSPILEFYEAMFAASFLARKLEPEQQERMNEILNRVLPLFP
jgi:aminoglycoside phosphotransferase (APT) family kinase protein